MEALEKKGRSPTAGHCLQIGVVPKDHVRRLNSVVFDSYHLVSRESTRSHFAYWKLPKVPPAPGVMVEKPCEGVEARPAGFVVGVLGPPSR